MRPNVRFISKAGWRSGNPSGEVLREVAEVSPPTGLEPAELRDLGESVIQSVDVLRVALALVPVLLFLAALRALDSYKLVSLRTVFAALAAGALAGVFCFT